MSIRAFMPVYNACIFGHLCMIQQYDCMTDDRAAQSPQAAPQSSFSPWSVSISRILLQAGHPLPAPNSLVSPHIVQQTQECRRKSSWSLCVQHIDFFPPYAHFISLLSCGFIFNCELGKIRTKNLLLLSIAWGLVFIFYFYCYFVPSTLIAMYIYFLDSLKGALGFGLNLVELNASDESNWYDI